MAAPGIIIHQIFPFGAFGPRQWSESELRRLMRWLKTLGYADVLFIPWGIYRAEDGPLTILEQGALYQSGLMAAPAFEPGQLYAPEDPFLGTRDGLRRAETLRITARAAREFGLRPWLALMTTLGAPGFTREHPELAAVNGIDLFNEGVGLCPSQPAARQHLLDLYEQQVRYFDAAAGFVLWQRDPGGCRCDRCMPQARMMGDLGNAFLAMIRRHRREEPVAFSAWHVNLAEVPDLARTLDPCLLIFESPRIHAADVSLDIFEERVKAWQVQGRQVESWLEVQENPTSLLPSVYPERMAEAVRRIQRLELARVWVSATQNPYLFPLHLWLTPRLWAEPADAGRLTAEFLRSTYGDYAVESGLDYAQATERAFDLTQALSTRAAGFLNLFVVTSPHRLLPEKVMREGVSRQLRVDSIAAVRSCEQAMKAAEAFAEAIQALHPLDANMLATSAEVLLWRVRMREAKIPVLEAIHAGDSAAAVAAWPAVQHACEEMVAAARNAPNTDVLNSHWRRLALLPDRLRALGTLLAALAHTKAFRRVEQPLEIGELYGNRNVFGKDHP